MQRIAIIGCGGSGKTTIGRQLAGQLGTQITHLDAIYYDDQWNTMDADEFAAAQEELVAAQTVGDRRELRQHPADPARSEPTPSSSSTCPPSPACGASPSAAGDTGGGQHDSTGVYDRITWGFVKYVWDYRKDMAPRVRTLIAEHAAHADVRIVTSRRAANRLLADLKASATA